MYTTLIQCNDLAARLEDPAWRIFDCRADLANREAGRRAYAAGHVPGAQHMHLEEALSGPIGAGRGRHPLPHPSDFAVQLRALGVSRHSQVVAYDAAGGVMASRLWWMLRWLGHEAVAVLDGGWQAWVQAGLPVSTQTPAPREGNLAADPRAWTVDSGFIQDHLGSPELVLIDARSADRFRGENETLDPVGGHIPGARNRPFSENLAPGGRFKPAALLREEFARLLAGAAVENVVHQCGSGVSACHNLLAMEIAGMPGSRLYAGSWSEWCSDPLRPIARG